MLHIVAQQIHLGVICMTIIILFMRITTIDNIQCDSSSSSSNVPIKSLSSLNGISKFCAINLLRLQSEISSRLANISFIMYIVVVVKHPTFVCVKSYIMISSSLMSMIDVLQRFNGSSRPKLYQCWIGTLGHGHLHV